MDEHHVLSESKRGKSKTWPCANASWPFVWWWKGIWAKTSLLCSTCVAKALRFMCSYFQRRRARSPARSETPPGREPFLMPEQQQELKALIWSEPRPNSVGTSRFFMEYVDPSIVYPLTLRDDRVPRKDLEALASHETVLDSADLYLGPRRCRTTAGVWKTNGADKKT